MLVSPSSGLPEDYVYSILSVRIQSGPISPIRPEATLSPSLEIPEDGRTGPAEFPGITCDPPRLSVSGGDCRFSYSFRGRGVGLLVIIGSSGGQDNGF